MQDFYGNYVGPELDADDFDADGESHEFYDPEPPADWEP